MLVVDQSSGSNGTMSGEVVKTLQITQTTTDSLNGTQETNGLHTQENDVPSNNIDLPSVEEIISVCEIRLRKYFKRRCMEHRQILAQGYDIYETPNSLNFGNENILIDYYKDPMNHPSRSLRREKVTTGSWLFLSFMSGGWSYDVTKKFIMKQYGVKHLRNRYISQRLAMEEEYKAVVKFRSSEELNQIKYLLLSMIQTRITRKKARELLLSNVINLCEEVFKRTPQETR
ncbi:unnamed protein product [Euphydryas editha]|uniref:Uncharacterized protein n=1 Tax=Euphydryas editha TaxID=104508 RepID=A0AAU9UXC8_EUPED|nr:unnamed protein product [Euphydryas editha]